MEINDVLIINYQEKIKYHILECNENAITIKIFTKHKIKIPKET